MGLRKYQSRLKNFLNACIRLMAGFKRPTRTSNMRLLQQRGETLTSLVIRKATVKDIHRLADLHVAVWNQTYCAKHPPTYYVREYQWRQQFEANDNSWFCFVVENKLGELVGFAKGAAYACADLPGYDGQLQQLYLLRPYQRLGIGRRLLCQVARCFLSRGINSMVLFGIPQNPSCRFHEAMGGKRLYAANGEFHGGYGWRYLSLLLSGCPDNV